MKLCLLFLLTLTLTEQLPLDFKGSAGGEKAEARVLKFPSEEIMPGVLAIPANIELPDCSDPKNNALCQTQSQCQDNDCLLATLLTEKNNDLTIEKNEDKSSFDMADFFDLVYDTMEKVDRTRRDTYGEFDDQ